MLAFEVAIRTARLEANCDVVLYSLFESSAARVACQTYARHQQVSTVVGALCATRRVLDHETEGKTP